MGLTSATRFIVSGPSPALFGDIRVPGCKNSAMPILVASALAGGNIAVSNVPQIGDINVLLTILSSLGIRCESSGSEVEIERGPLIGKLIPKDLSSRLRGSIYAVALLAAFSGRGFIGPIGGDAIAGRSLEPHARALAGFGIEMSKQGNGWQLSGKPAKRGEFLIADRGISATCLAVLIAAAIDGVTTLHEASLEFECDDVLEAVRFLGAEAWRDGRTIVVKGPMAGRTANLAIPYDHLVWGTFAIAVAMTGGTARGPAGIVSRSKPILEMFENFGVCVHIGDQLTTSGPPISSARVVTGMFPMFPSDLLPQAMAMSTLVPGDSYFDEVHYGARFDHVPAFKQMGAHISIEGTTARVTGGKQLRGTTVRGAGIRESTSLVLAGLVAKGTTEITSASSISRGYEDLAGDLRRLGAKLIER